MGAARIRAGLALCCLAAALAGPGLARAQPAGGAETQLGLIEAYYLEGERYRAETELLRFLAEQPRHPRRAEVELVRAKLYYREGRYGESSLMLFSQLDRYRGAPAARSATRLLAMSLIREGRLDEATAYAGALARPGAPAPSLARLRGIPADAVAPETAVTWSTWLPGSGFFLLGEPGKAVAGMSLNLFFTAAAVVAFQQELPGVGLVFLLAELAMYRGGRRAVREEATAQLTRLRARRAANWLRAHGEPELLGFGLRLKF